jgi:type II secretory pathway pseudopilin PulG
MTFLQNKNRRSPVLANRTGGEDGFALIEALIASALFGVVMMGIVSMMVGSTNANRLARDVTEASALASDVIEQLASLKYENDDLQNNTVAWPDTEDGKYTFTVTTSPDAIVDNTMSIAVTVSWQDRGRTRNVTINDIIVDFI